LEGEAFRWWTRWDEGVREKVGCEDWRTLWLPNRRRPIYS